MPKIFYIQYHVRPLPGNEDFSKAGGAYVNCYVLEESEEKACGLAYQYFVNNRWEVVSIEEEPVVTSRERYLDDPETLESFDEAVTNGECYVFYLWPIDAQDDDLIH